MKSATMRIVAGVAVSTAVLAGTTLTGAAPAAAASNGQQVYIDSHDPHDGYAYLYGQNQDGKTVSSPSIKLNSSGYGQLDSWWWKGDVIITYFAWDGSYAGQSKCSVPENQWWSNWTAC
jgi:hypothetical protein